MSRDHPQSPTARRGRWDGRRGQAVPDEKGHVISHRGLQPATHPTGSFAWIEERAGALVLQGLWGSRNDGRQVTSQPGGIIVKNRPPSRTTGLPSEIQWLPAAPQPPSTEGVGDSTVGGPAAALPRPGGWSRTKRATCRGQACPGGGLAAWVLRLAPAGRLGAWGGDFVNQGPPVTLRAGEEDACVLV